MHKVVGQLRVRDSDVTVTDLTVHVYATGVRSVPQSVLEPERWDTLMRADWKGLEAQRIGSAMAASDGRFHLSYDPKSLLRGQSPNLWLAVTGPDLSRERICDRVLHASCDIRGDAGAHESFVIYLLPRRLRAFGLLGGAPKHVPGDVAAEMRGVVETVAGKVPSPDTGGQSFSAFFNARETETAMEMAQKGLSRPRQSEVGLTVSLRSSAAEGAAGMTLAKDDRTGRLTVVQDGRARPRRLTYAGIDRVAPETREATAAAAEVQINPARGTFELRLARVPDTLRLPDQAGLPLWTPPAVADGERGNG